MNDKLFTLSDYIGIDEFERIKTEINSKLPQYIEAMGFAIKGRSGSIRCPNKSAHKHGDKTPSASMWIGSGGIPVWFCHQCSSGTDLFEFARYAEPDLPMHGSAFVTKTIPHLCETLGIPFSIEELSPRINNKLFTLSNYRGEVLASYPDKQKADGVCSILNRWYYQWLIRIGTDPSVPRQPYYKLTETAVR